MFVDCIAQFPEFSYHEIARAGNKMGQTSLADIDKDGDLDWVVGCRNGEIWWFEFRGPDNWHPHTIGQQAVTDVAGTAFDVDKDGWIDQVSGENWYRNPGNSEHTTFVEYNFGGTKAHDQVAADMDGDGMNDLVAMWDKDILCWYKIPTQPTKNWQKIPIGAAVHGGIGPRGIGDLDNDGDNDVVRSNYWFENLDGKGMQWKEHRNINFGQPDSQYPYMTKSWVLDIDMDGDNDIMQSEGDCESGRLAWHENRDGKGRNWVVHMILENSGQDLHSLAIADFDNDGDQDIFTGGGPLSKTAPQWILMENSGSRNITWKKHILLEGKECHEAVAADVDNDGDIDICSKPWNGDLHIFLQNQLISQK